MGYDISDFDDDMGQSVLVQQEQHTIGRENEQLCNSSEAAVGGSESVENSDNDGRTRHDITDGQTGSWERAMDTSTKEPPA